jgi:hypothetical protein
VLKIPLPGSERGFNSSLWLMRNSPFLGSRAGRSTRPRPGRRASYTWSVSQYLEEFHRYPVGVREVDPLDPFVSVGRRDE